MPAVILSLAPPYLSPMYTPAHFRQDDRAAQLAFMRQHPFATMVNAVPGAAPVASHLPFVVEERGNEVWLVAHLARANRQWELFAAAETLVIFQEPHAYISPRWYDKERSVPTWNYVAVHAYGRPRIHDDEAAVFQNLEKLILQSEPAYREHWNRLPMEYKTGMIKGLVAFDIKVERLEGKEKLSQNRSENEIRQIIAGLEQSTLSGDRQMAALMREKYQP